MPITCGHNNRQKRGGIFFNATVAPVCAACVGLPCAAGRRDGGWVILVHTCRLEVVGEGGATLRDVRRLHEPILTKHDLHAHGRCMYVVQSLARHRLTPSSPFPHQLSLDDRNLNRLRTTLWPKDEGRRWWRGLPTTLATSSLNGPAPIDGFGVDGSWVIHVCSGTA